MGIFNFRNQSIQRKMRTIIAIQILISVLFLMYTIFTTVYLSYNDVSNRCFQTGEQMLANTENAIEKLSEAAFFPTSFSMSNNDFTISRSLKDRCISRDYYLYSYFSQQGRSQLNTGGVEMMALYDMDGHGVAVQNGSYSEYRACFVSEDAKWYNSLREADNGAPVVIGSSDVEGSGMPDVDGNFLWVGRGIMDITTFQIAGYCVAGVSRDSIVDIFDSLKLSPRQIFAVYGKDRLLLSSDDAFFEPIRKEWADVPDESVHRKEISVMDHLAYLVNTVRHDSGYTIVVGTPLADAVGNIGGFTFTFTLAVGLFLIVMVFNIVSSVHYIVNAMDRLIDACDHFELEKNTRIDVCNLPEEISYLFKSFNRMSDRIRSLVGEVVAKQNKLQETELQLLRTQINPHYLYNTLEMIHMRAYMKKNYDVANMAELLGQNLQYGLRNTTQKVPLRTELEQVNIYLQILSFHYGNRVQTSIFVEQALMDCRIPKLIFQPIIENSVVHGIVSSDQVLNIDIMGYRNGDTIVFRISDDGCGMDEAQLCALRESIRDTNSVSIGLRNVCRRILLNYGEEYQAEIESKKNVGSTVTLYLPYQLTEEAEEADRAEEESNGSR